MSLSLLALSLQVGLLLSLSSVTATSDKSPVAHTEPTAGGLSVSPQLERVSVLPGCVGRPALDVVGSVTLLSKTSALSARRRQTSHLSVLVHGVADPVDLGVVSDRVVRRVHENHIVVLVGTVLVHPVRVQHSQVRASLADSVFGHGLQVSGELKLVDTVVLGLSEHNASRVRSLSASSSHSASVHNVTLLANTAKNTVNKDWQKSKKLSSLPPLSPSFSPLPLSPSFLILSPSLSGQSLCEGQPPCRDHLPIKDNSPITPPQGGREE